MLELEFVCGYKFKGNAHMLNMLLPCLTENQNVIWIYKTKFPKCEYKLSSMNNIKVVGSLVIPKSITNNLYNSNFILNLFFHVSLSAMLI
jgi:hypothetical protein